MPRLVYPEAIAHFPESFRIFIILIFNRIVSGRNALIAILGATGSGKSYLGLEIIIGIFLYQHGRMPTVEEVMDRTFFKAKNIMKRINDPNLKKVDMGLWDESGIDIGHKTFMSVQNRVIGYLVQTFRNLQQCIIFTTPSASFIDASVRKLLHYHIETVGIDKKKKICHCKPLRMQYNPRMDKTYYHRLTYPDTDGDLIEVDIMRVPKPPQEYCKAYEDVKSEFTRALNLSIQATLNKLDAKNENPLTETQTEIMKLLEAGITSRADIAKKLNKHPTVISRNYGFIRRKGVDVDKYLKKRGELRE